MPQSQQFTFHMNAFNIGLNSLTLNNVAEVMNGVNVNSLSAIENAAPGTIIGYNLWKLWYDRYLVKSVVTTIEFVNTGTIPVYVGIAYRPVEGEVWNTWSTFRTLDANTFPNVQELLTASGGSKDRVVLKLPCNLESLWGLYDEHQGDLDFSGQTQGIGFPPNRPQSVIFFALSGTGQPVQAQISTKISFEFNTTMYQLKTQNGN